MQVTVNRDICEEPHLFNQVEAVFILRLTADGRVHTSFAPGRFLLIYWPAVDPTEEKAYSYNELFYPDGSFTRAEMEGLGHILGNLATRFPGGEMPKDTQHLIIGHKDDGGDDGC